MYSARDCIAAVEKRLNNRNPNVQLYALAVTIPTTLLFCFVSNLYLCIVD